MHDEGPVTRAQLLRRVAALAPRLAARAPQTSADRRLPAQTIADLQEAGLLRILQPARFGGLEMAPGDLFAVQIEVAAACPSTAWVLGVVAVHSWQLALFPEQAQQEVWGEDGGTLISSSYMPVGQVTAVAGGYRLRGRWGFSSGSDHCDWAFLGAFVPTEPGQPPDMRTFLVPRCDYRLEDTWHVSGLRGTGSNDVVVEDAFVPAHRTHRFSDGFRCHSPGNAVNTAPLYRLPFGQIFVRSVSTPAIGMALGALRAYQEIMAAKISRASGKPGKESPAARQAAAAAAAAVRDSQLVLDSSFREMMRCARAGEAIALEERVRWRYDSTEAVRRCVAAVDALFTHAGSSAIFLSSPLQRYFQDIHACRAHYANSPEGPGHNLGGVLFGQRSTDYFI